MLDRTALLSDLAFLLRVVYPRRLGPRGDFPAGFGHALVSLCGLADGRRNITGVIIQVAFDAGDRVAAPKLAEQRFCGSLDAQTPSYRKYIMTSDITSTIPEAVPAAATEISAEPAAVVAVMSPAATAVAPVVPAPRVMEPQRTKNQVRAASVAQGQAIVAKWKTQIAEAKTIWEKVPAAELAKVDGNFHKLAGLVQLYYRVSREESDRQVKEFFDRHIAIAASVV